MTNNNSCDNSCHKTGSGFLIIVVLYILLAIKVHSIINLNRRISNKE